MRPAPFDKLIRRRDHLPMPLPLSVAIVCKNNESTIGRTLESVARLASEIVAVDSGSTDGTIALLEKHGARVIRSPWLGHVKTKQLALEACAQDWILCLDSDESLDSDLRARVQLPETLAGSSADGFSLRRKVFYQDRPLNFAWQPEWRLRLVRRGRARWRGLDPHDQLALVDARAIERRLDTGFVRHDSISTWAEFFAKQAAHARTMAQSMHREGAGPSAFRLMVSPVGAFLKQMVLKQAWRDGWPGWLAAASTASGSLMKHAILFELANTANSDLGGGPGPATGPAPGPVSGSLSSSASRPASRSASGHE